MRKLSQLESIGVKFAELLRQAGIEDQQQLLDTCCKQSARLALAKQTGINPKLICKWTTLADLARISGIGEVYAELLEYCTIDSIQVLAQFNPEKLYLNLQQINEETKLAHQMPSISQVQSWIEQAKTLPKMIER